MRDAIVELVCRSLLALDARDFEGFLALCAEDFRYTVQVFSPEIRRDMVWLDHDKAGLATLFRALSRHQSDPAPLTRHATVYTVTFEDRDARALIVSALQVFRTTPDGGVTSLFAVGKVHDVVRVTDGKPLLTERTIRLDTRQLGIGTHVPI